MASSWTSSFCLQKGQASNNPRTQRFNVLTDARLEVVRKRVSGKLGAMAPCSCSAVGAACYVQHLPEGMLASLTGVAQGPWMKLYRCGQCGQHWSIDAYEPYQPQVALAVSSANGWSSADTTGARKSLLLMHRGGTSSESCQWAGCGDNQVKGVVYCLEHLWNCGVRI